MNVKLQFIRQCFMAIFVISGPVGAAQQAQEADLLTLLEAVSVHPRLQVQSAAVDAATARLSQIESDRNPRISLAANGDLASSADEATVLGLTAETTLFDWGLNEAQVGEASRRVASEQARRVMALEGLEQRVIDQFTRAQRVNAQLRAIEASIEDVSEFRAIISRRVEQKINPYSDLLAIDGRAAQYKTALLQLRGELRSSQLALLELTGLKAQLTENRQCGGQVDEASAIEQAVNRAPGIRAARADAEAMLAQQSVLKARRLPALVGGVELAQDVQASEDQSRAYLGFQYRFEVGGGFAAEEAELQARYMDLVYQERVLTQELVRDVAELVSQFEVGRSQRDVFETMVEVRSTQLDALMRRFNAGQTTLLDVTGTQKELHDARLALEDAQALTCRSWYQLQQRIGWAQSDE